MRIDLPAVIHAIKTISTKEEHYTCNIHNCTYISVDRFRGYMPETVNRPLSGMSDGEVLEWWKSTGLASLRPELCEEIAPVQISPPEDIVPFLLEEAQVRPEWADSSRLQCNICGNKAKFKSGGYYAHYCDGYIYVIGPVCGSDNHQKSVAEAKNVFEKRKYREIADDRVRDFVDNHHLWEDRLKRVEDYNKVSERLRICISLDFGSNSELIWDDIYSSIKEDGGTLKHYPEGKGYVKNIHRLSCVDIFSQQGVNSISINEITGNIAKLFGFSFKGKNKEVVYNVDNVSDLSQLLSDLNREIKIKEECILRAQQKIVDDVRGILRWQEKTKTHMKFSAGTISGEFKHGTEMEKVFCNFMTLNSSYQFERL